MRDLIRKYEIKPSKKFGQNFLINKGILEKVVKAGEIKPTDVVLEIGPGLGVLTKELAKKAKKVIAVEKDKKLIKLLEEELKDFNNIEIINADILKMTRGLSSGHFKVVANLPFNIASAVIRKFLEAENNPESMVLIVQKEVAQRITAKPPRMSILALSVQLYAEPKIISYISKGSFWPAPNVDAAILKLLPKSRPGLLTTEFFRIARAGFAHPRKQLAGNLSKELGIKKEAAEKWLKANNIDPKQRAETLSLADWLKLTSTFTSSLA